MLDELEIPPGLDGLVGRHVAGTPVHPHHHVELEVNLVVRGTATYLLGERRYELGPGTLTWLFPAQDHVLVDQSADHELRWAVFTPELVRRVATTPEMRLLLEADPAGQFSRQVSGHQRLTSLFDEIRDGDRTVANTGLAHLLALAWRRFVDSEDVVAGTDLHPAVRTAVHLLRTDPDAGDLTRLARTAGLSASHLSRLFKAQVGVPLSRYRNQQRLHRFHAIHGPHTTAMSAALAAGFGSYAQFYRVYRRETGRTISARTALSACA